MDLKEIIAKAKNIAESAHSSFHAGRLDDAENYLMVEMQTIARYFDAKTKPAGEVTESTNHENPEADQSEKPAEVPGAQEWPGAVDPVFGGQGSGSAQETSKPTQ